jgi:tetratricopeptide (TPR) repeat protein
LNRRERRAAGRKSQKAAQSGSAASNRKEADDLCSAGITLQQQGRFQEAFNAFDRAVRLSPDRAESWTRHGDALASLNRPVDSLASYERALKVDPRHADAAYGRGLVLLRLKRLEDALSSFNLSAELQPNRAAVLEQRAMLLQDLRRFDEALVDAERAHTLDPASFELCNMVGFCLHKLCRDEEALPWFDKALALRPDSTTALRNKAHSLAQMRRIDEALLIYDRAKAIDPYHIDAVQDLSHLHLLMGDFEAGWAGLKPLWYNRNPIIYYPNFVQPIWLGDTDIDGKTILVYSNEGAGDAIQFARYVPMLSARGAQTILVVSDRIHGLMSTLPDVAQCLPRSVPSLPPFDMHCPMTTLPMAFATRLDTIPSATAYLSPPPEPHRRAWEDRLQSHLGPQRRLRIGLVWSGNPKQPNDHNRSMPFRMLAGLLEAHADVDFVSLQKDPRACDRAPLAESGILDLTSDFADYTETAALMSCLDLVIAVDTGVAHLAGALGHPLWIMLTFAPDWRYLLDRDDSPWYASARLFRQTEKGNWLDLVARVSSALTARKSSLGPR